MNKMIKTLIILLLSILWMMFIFKLSSMNKSNSNGKSVELISIFIEDTLDITNEYGITSSYPTDQKLERASTLINPPLRKVMHASVYFVLSFIIIVSLDILSEHKHYLWIVCVTFGICVCFAITDEFHQTFVSGRTGQLLDVFIDSAGSASGILFYTTYHIIYKLGLKNGMSKQ